MFIYLVSYGICNIPREMQINRCLGRYWIGATLHLGLWVHQGQLRAVWSRVETVFALRQPIYIASWWRHQVEPFSALLAFCAGNSPVTGEFPAQRSVTRSFDVFFDLRLRPWTNSWANNGDAGDLRRHRAHYDVIVMPRLSGQGWRQIFPLRPPIYIAL